MLSGTLTLGHFPVGREVELVQGNQRFAFLHLAVSVFFLALFVQVDAPSLSALFPPGAGQLQIRV